MGSIISGGLSFVLSLLPDSPFSSALDSLANNSNITNLLGMVNWFVPFYLFLPIFVAWLACVAIYYVYQVVLRWLNAIE